MKIDISKLGEYIAIASTLVSAMQQIIKSIGGKPLAGSTEDKIVQFAQQMDTTKDYSDYKPGVSLQLLEGGSSSVTSFVSTLDPVSLSLLASAVVFCLDFFSKLIAQNKAGGLDDNPGWKKAAELAEKGSQSVDVALARKRAADFFGGLVRIFQDNLGIISLIAIMAFGVYIVAKK